jgi:hypothetical protein
LRGAVEIACSIQHQARSGKFSVGSPSEPVKHGLVAGRIQLEYRSAPVKPAIRTQATGDPTLLGSAVKVARRVLNQTCYWICPVWRAGECVKQSESLRLRRLRCAARKRNHYCQCD